MKDFDGSAAKVEVNGTLYSVEMDTPIETTAAKTPQIVQAAPVHTGTNQPVKTAPPLALCSVKAPLPGVVLDVFVHTGDQVQVGQKLLLLEAMKMENTIEAHKTGKVSAVKVGKGDSVLEGADLVVIE